MAERLTQGQIFDFDPININGSNKFPWIHYTTLMSSLVGGMGVGGAGTLFLLNISKPEGAAYLARTTERTTEALGEALIIATGITVIGTVAIFTADHLIHRLQLFRS